MLSQKTKYTIRALQHLADKYGQGNTQLKEISESQNIPSKFLTIILSELSRAGIVKSQRGPDGGYELVLAPQDIKYGDILRLTNGALALVPCASKYNYKKCNNCVDENICRTKKLMIKLRQETAKILDRITLADELDIDDDL